MTSLEDETGRSLAPYTQRKVLTMASLSDRSCAGYLGTNWARDKSPFEFAVIE
jgi:hypothetical protein